MRYSARDRLRLQYQDKEGNHVMLESRDSLDSNTPDVACLDVMVCRRAFEASELGAGRHDVVLSTVGRQIGSKPRVRRGDN